MKPPYRRIGNRNRIQTSRIQCADCNNQMMLEMFGKDNTFHYAKIIIISETAPSTLRGVSATWHCNARDGCGPHRSAPRRSEALLGQTELAGTV